MKSSLCLSRNVPALVTRLTRKCPGYSSGGSRSGKARGGGVAGAGRPAAEKVVRPLVVVQRPKAIERALLRGEMGTGWATGPGFQGPVHAFVRPVLLGRGGGNALMLDSPPPPPTGALGRGLEAARGGG